ncbi:MAG: CIA30 family protein [Polaribacter sp.]
MKKILTILSIFVFMKDANTIIYDFNSKSKISDWRVVDDVVMGGLSDGNFSINENGNGEYSGKVSTENNGGFSSLRYLFSKINIENYTKVKIRLKGDGKKYQFRIKRSRNDYHSYIFSFITSKKWQTIEINLSDMYPAFRGRNLDMPNLSSKNIEEIAFLIGNKKEESFLLELDKIYLE